MAERWWRTRRFAWMGLVLVLVVGGLAGLASVGSNVGSGDRSLPGAYRGEITPVSNQTQVLDTGRGQVAGRVVGTNGKPLAGVEVVVRTAPFRSYSTGPSAPRMPPGPTWKGMTNKQGRYRIADVGVGPHRVSFAKRGRATVFNGRALDVDSAPDVSVKVNATTKVNAVLARAGQIRGIVKRAAGGRVGPNVTVEAVLAGRDGGAVLSSNVTRSRGRYVLDGLAPGRYVVRVRHPRSGVVHHPAATRKKSAKVVRVKEGGRLSGINIKVPKPAVVTGRVLSKDGDPVSGAVVQSYERIQDAGRYGSFPVGLQKVRTDRAGRFRIKSPTGSLTFWSGEAWLGACDPTSASVEGLRIDAGRTYVRDLRATAPLKISGTVTDSDGNLLEGVPVFTDGVRNACSETVRTDASGRYAVTGLVPGPYRVLFGGDGEGPSGYFPQYHDGATRQDQTKPLVLEPGRSREGINASLKKGGQIAGRVVLPRGVRLKSLSVVAVTGGENGSNSFEQRAVVEDDGGFTVVGLRAGRYRLSFNPIFSNEWGQEVPTHRYVRSGSSADLEAENEIIEVTEGLATGGIEVELDLGGSISGTLVDGSGGPREGVEVAVYRRGRTVEGDVDWIRVAATRADSRGLYAVRGLGAGTYRVGFAGTEYYPDVERVEDAKDLELDSDEALTGIDAEVVFDWD